MKENEGDLSDLCFPLSLSLLTSATKYDGFGAVKEERPRDAPRNKTREGRKEGRREGAIKGWALL